MRLAFRVFLTILSCIGCGIAGDVHVRAQHFSEREWLAVHPRVGLGYHSHSSSISNFEGVSDCGVFTKGTSVKPNFSLTLETPLNSELFLGLGVRYADRSANIFADNTSAPALDISKQSGVDVVFENTIQPSLRYVDILPELRVQVMNIGKAIQRVSLGAIIGFPIDPTFTQQQRIVSPENAVYKVNNQQVVTLSKGTQSIQSINKILVGATFGFENLLVVGKSSFFTQQLSFEYVFNDLVTSAPWKVMAVRADIGFRFSFQSTPLSAPSPPVKVQPRVDSIKQVITKSIETVKPLPILRAHIDSVNAYLQTGSELRATSPLVNAVFFDPNSSVIPDRYILDKTQVKESDDAFQNHRAIVLSVARIMSDNPKATIVVEGSTSGTDENGGLLLASQRAEAVKEALVNAGIEKERVSVRAVLTPRIASNSDYPQGREENRRADIILNNAPLQEYVARQKFVQLKGEMSYSIDAQFFESGDIRVMSNVAKEQILSTSGSRTVEIDQRIPSDKGPFTIDVSANAPPFLNSRDEHRLDLEDLRRETIVLNLRSFDAVLRFDYNSSEFSQANKDLLRQLVKVLPEGSTIQVLGSADALGDESSNRQLSERRASSTESYIRSITANKFKIESSISTQKYDESKPEGRFLNRSIRIRVGE